MNTLTRINEIKERLNEISADINTLVDNLNDFSKDFYNEYNICSPYLTDVLNDYICGLCDVQDSKQRKWVYDCIQSTQYIDEALKQMNPNHADSYLLIGKAQYLYFYDLLYKDFSKLQELRNLHIERGELEQELAELEREQVA